jgi:short-subunit dehydrogenase
MKIFITGSTGFIGKKFLDLLLKSHKDHQLVLLQRHSNGINFPNLRILESDLHNVESYKQELLDSDYVFHIAASADVTSSIESVSNDHAALEKMLGYLKGNANFKRFVFISTIGAYDRAPNDPLKHPISNLSQRNPRSKYGILKLKSEILIKESHIPFTIFRPSWVWGEGMRASSHLAFFNRLMEKGSIVARVGFSGLASFVHVDDLAQGLAKVIQDNNKYLNKSYFVATEDQKISDLMKKLWILNGKSSWQFPVGFVKILSSLHRFLPLPINFLFLDYLVCDQVEFVSEFQITSPKLLENSLQEVRQRDQYAIVTGSNSGIGFELAKLLKSRYRLLLIDQDISNLELNFPEAIILQIDLSDRNVLMNCLRDLNLNRRVSLLVNNAGVGFKAVFAEANLEKDLLTVDVNINAPIILSHHFKKDLTKTKGTLVNIASSVGHFPLPHMATYAASKSFISSWSQGIEEELREKINIVTFSPSGTLTNFQKQAGVKDSTGLASPVQVAQEILNLILKDKSDSRILGAKSKILRLIVVFSPRKMGLQLIAKLFKGSR